MAQVTHTPALRERIDFALDYVAREWEGVPDLVQEWAEWEELDRTIFEHEWAIPESHLAYLNRWAEQGLLSPEQRARYQELLLLIARHRPTLEGLFAR